MKQAVLLGLAVVMVALLAAPVGCCEPAAPAAPTPVLELAIPPYFTTYTDDDKLFSISYPPHWKTAPSALTDTEEAVTGLIESLESGLPLQERSLVFFAGVAEEGFDPNVNIFVQPLPFEWSTVEEVADVTVRTFSCSLTNTSNLPKQRQLSGVGRQ